MVVLRWQSFIESADMQWREFIMYLKTWSSCRPFVSSYEEWKRVSLLSFHCISLDQRVLRCEGEEKRPTKGVLGRQIFGGKFVAAPQNTAFSKKAASYNKIISFSIDFSLQVRRNQQLYCSWAHALILVRLTSYSPLHKKRKQTEFWISLLRSLVIMLFQPNFWEPSRA